MKDNVNYYYLRYVCWDGKDYATEFIAPAHTALDAKIICDVAIEYQARSSIPMKEWRLQRMELATDEMMQKAEVWQKLAPGSKVKKYWSERAVEDE